APYLTSFPTRRSSDLLSSHELDTRAATGGPLLYALPGLARPRRTLSPRIGYAVAALVVGLGLFASVTPSPLYHTYSVLWHFSPRSEEHTSELQSPDHL